MKKAMSLKAKIRELSKTHRIPAQAVLQSYMFERLLERLSISRFKDQLILKGGLLIASMVGIGHRTTMDMDATVRNYPMSEESILSLISEICEVHLSDDVALKAYAIEPIRTEDEYGGFRVSLVATLEGIEVPLKVDITTDDAITPGAVRHQFSTLFDDHQIELWAYNIETVLAEKYETILRRGVLNTRTRDFYDVYSLYGTQSFNLDTLHLAILATADKRGSSAFLPDKATIFAAIRQNDTMRQRWSRYCEEYSYANGIEFDSVIDLLARIY